MYVSKREADQACEGEVRWSVISPHSKVEHV